MNILKIYLSMRFLVTILIILPILNSCQTVVPKQQIESHYPPKQFNIVGKMSMINKKKSYFFDLSWQETPAQKEIILKSSTYLWELNIVQNANGTWINNQLIEQSLEQWLIKKYQLVLPIEQIKKWVFLPNDNPPPALTILSTQQWMQHQVAKKIRFKHPNKAVMTLLIKKITI